MKNNVMWKTVGIAASIILIVGEVLEIKELVGEINERSTNCQKPLETSQDRKASISKTTC